MYKKTMRVLLSIAVVVVLVSSAGLAAGEEDTTNVDVTVTPGGVTAGLSTSTDTYKFGIVDLAKSSRSATGVLLTNTGSASSVLDKSITTITDWSLAYSTGTQDQVVFGAAEAQNRPGLTDFWSYGGYENSPSSFTFTEGADTASYDALRNYSTGNQVLLEPEEGATTWFKIDVPNATGNSNQKTISVQFRATTQ